MRAPERYALGDTGQFPNSAHPVLVYRGAVSPEPQASRDLAAEFERLFAEHGWPPAWRNGVYATHHYHSTAHEVLGIAAGWVRARFGGEAGVLVELRAGDAVVIPAGVAHFNAGQSRDLCVVGAYAGGAEYDMQYGRAGERPSADQRIAALPVPKRDPVFGRGGPLPEIWSGAARGAADE